MTLGGESTAGDLVVASLLVASLPGGEVTINLFCGVNGFLLRFELY